MNRRRKGVGKTRKVKLTPDQVRDMMENKLRAQSIPSKKKYNRKKKES